MFGLFLLLGCANSLFEDQVGMYDWHKMNLGRIIDAWPSPGGNTIALSDRGLLSLIRPTGEIEWRRVVESLDSKVIAVATSSETITYSSGFLTSWSAKEGLVLWKVQSSDYNQIALINNNIKDILLGLTSSSLEAIDISDGETITKLEIKNISKILGKTEDFLIVLTSNKTIFEINLKSWAVLKVETEFFENFVCAKTTCISIENDTSIIYYNRATKEMDWKLPKVVKTIDKYFVLEDDSLVYIADWSPVFEVTSPESTKKVLLKSKMISINNNPLWLTESESGIHIERIGGSLLIENTKRLPSVIGFWGYASPKSVMGYIVLEDYTFISFKDTRTRWVREEGLGHITSVYFIELPSKEQHRHNQYFAYIQNHDTWSDVLTNIVLRVQSQITTPNHEISTLERDNFALKKLIIAVSQSGYLIAIQSVNAQIVWKLKLNNIQNIIQTNTEEALIVTNNRIRTSLVYVNIITGDIILNKTLDFLAENSLKIEQDGDINVYLLDRNFEIYPVISKKSYELFFYSINLTDNSVKGYQYNDNKKTLIWNIQISKKENIVSYIKNRSGKIHQPAIATGTSRLIYKYADENLFALATQKGSDLYIYIINGVSGYIVYRIHQDFVSGPIHLLFHEHKLYIHYWSSKSDSYEFLSIELFKSNVEESALSMVKNYLSGGFPTEYSSRFTPEITVFSQTFSMPSGVKGMKMSMSLQGITKPNLVMILNNNQIYLLDSSYLSPRRKFEDSVEAGLFDDPSLLPYKANLIWSSKNIVSYYLNLEGLQGLEITDTWLESTSIAVAFGLDMFSVKLMPEKGFDILAEDFSKTAIVVTIIGLIALNFVVQKWYFSKSSKEKFNT
jgi:ER membrane protein complex subunit 1, C-terminal